MYTVKESKDLTKEQYFAWLNEEVLVDVEDVMSKLDDCKATIENGDDLDPVQTSFLDSIGINIKYFERKNQ